MRGRLERCRPPPSDCRAVSGSGGVREAEGLQNDNDFAYAYLDYDQVLGLAGHHVANDWLQTRARVEEGLLAAGARWKASLMFLPSHAQ